MITLLGKRCDRQQYKYIQTIKILVLKNFLLELLSKKTIFFGNCILLNKICITTLISDCC